MHNISLLSYLFLFALYSPRLWDLQSNDYLSCIYPLDFKCLTYIIKKREREIGNGKLVMNELCISYSPTCSL